MTTTTMPKKQVNVFISHKSDIDGALAREVAAKIRKPNSVTTWVCSENIRSGQIWPTEISKAVHVCNIMLILMTTDWLDSKECELEYNMARKREVIDASVRIIPICKNYSEAAKKHNGLFILSNYNGIMQENNDDWIEEVIEEISKYQDTLSEVVVGDSANVSSGSSNSQPISGSTSAIPVNQNNNTIDQSQLLIELERSKILKDAIEEKYMSSVLEAKKTKQELKASKAENHNQHTLIEKLTTEIGSLKLKLRNNSKSDQQRHEQQATVKSPKVIGRRKAIFNFDGDKHGFMPCKNGQFIDVFHCVEGAPGSRVFYGQNLTTGEKGKFRELFTISEAYSSSSSESD